MITVEEVRQELPIYMATNPDLHKGDAILDVVYAIQKSRTFAQLKKALSELTGEAKEYCDGHADGLADIESQVVCGNMDMTVGEVHDTIVDEDSEHYDLCDVIQELMHYTNDDVYEEVLKLEGLEGY